MHKYPTHYSLVPTPRQLQLLYAQGGNISSVLRDMRGLDHNTDEIIEVAYDLQAGSYVAAMEDPALAGRRHAYAREIAATIRSLCEPVSILEPGVGEATTLSGVIQNLGPEVDAYGFDLSWSRICCAREWLRDQGCGVDATLCTGNLLDIPFADNSIDVVYTSHSIEPNGGNEVPILRELLRVAGRFLVLLEPAYELASEPARERMRSHGYCQNLPGFAADLGFEVLRHELFPHSANPMNPTALTVVRVGEDFAPPAHVLACPQFKTPLKTVDGQLFSSEALSVYPIVGGVPCLRSENAIFASLYEDRRT